MSDIDLDRGRQAALRVKEQGGSAMEQTLAWIATSFDETAAARRREAIERRRAAFNREAAE